MNNILTKNGFVDIPEEVSRILMKDYTVYEVFRVIKGVPLFLEDHYQRLVNSLMLQNTDVLLNYADFSEKAMQLIEVTHTTDGNIRFVILPEGEELNWYFAFVPAVYPNADNVRNGVDTELFEAERLNPNAKVLQKDVRFTANRLIEEHRLFEVLLVDHEGFITEGSRSNVFFVKGQMFYTAPAEMVLVGITRIKVFDCLKELGFPVVEKAIHLSELSSFEAVFLTGTSPKVLPVKSIGNLSFSSGHAGVRTLIQKYDELTEQYLTKFRQNR